MTVRELNVFTCGDSEKISTWSNVPYFFVRSLLANGIKVNRIDIGRSLAEKVLDRTIWRGLTWWRAPTTYDYSRSLLHHWIVRRKISRALKTYPDADANVFLTFSFSSAGLSAKPAVLFGDWTYDHQLRYFANRQADHRELSAVSREDRQIEQASAVFVLFPGVAAYMRERYQNPHIHYLGNVVNAPIEPTRGVLEDKLNSRSILFIGGLKYLEGARRLIEAYELLSAKRPELTLDIIGMKANHFRKLPAGVVCHGYLDKATDSDRKKYYDLLARARVVVNTTPKWGAFSATLEAMHFYTPVLTTAYDEFVSTFGREIRFGAYDESQSPATLSCNVARFFRDDHYLDMCRCAHESVSGYSWDAYVKRFLESMATVAA